MKNFTRRFLFLTAFLCSSLFASAEVVEDVVIDSINYFLDTTTKRATVYPYPIDLNIYYHGDMVIPDTVVYQNETYVVTDIGPFAFYHCREMTSIKMPPTIKTIEWQAFTGCPGLTSIELPASVSYIGEGVFYDCRNLREYICHATTPPICEDNTFLMVDMDSCTLNVPEESIDLYKNATGWKDFFNVEAVSDVSRIMAGNTGKVDVYALNGALLRRDVEASQVAAVLPKGIYVINGRKIMVK